MSKKRHHAVSVSLTSKELQQLQSINSRPGWRPSVLDGDGVKTELPESIFQAFEQIVELMAAGHSLFLMPHQEELTTQEAAEILNVSRPFLVKLLDQKQIPYLMVGRHRRVRMEDLLAYQNRREKSSGADSQKENAFEQRQMVSYIADFPDYRLRYISPQIEAFTGYSAETWMSNPTLLLEALHPDDKGRVIAALEQAIASKTSFVAEYRILDRDGNIRWFRDEASLNDNVVGVTFHGTLIDITRYREIEEALQKRIDVEELLVNISTRFINLPPEAMEEEFLQVLERVARFLGSDRIYIYQFSEGSKFISMTHEWCDAELPSLQGDRQNLLVEDHRWFVDTIIKRENIAVSRIQDLPSANFRTFLMKNGIRSLLVVPLVDGGRVIGAIGFSWVKKEKTFQAEEFMVFRRIADFFASSLQRTDREKRLLDINQRMREISSFSRSWFWEVDAKGCYTFYTPGIEEIFGFSAEQFIGKSLLDMVAGESERESFKRAMEKQAPLRDFINPRITRNGKRIWVLTNGTPFYDKAGEFQGYRGVSTDITKLREAQTNLSGLQQKLQAILKQSPVIFYSCEPFGDYSMNFVSDNLSLLGYRPEEFLIDPSLWLRLIHPEDAPNVFYQRRELFTNGSYAMDYRIRHQDGSYRWIHDESILVKEGDKPVEISGTWMDITERRRLEEMVIRTERRMMHFMAACPTVLYLCEPYGDYPITSISENIFGLTGYRSVEFLDNSALWGQTVHPEDAPTVFYERRRLFEKGFISQEYRILHRDGSLRWVRDEASLVKEAGKPVEIIGSLADITEQKKLEQELSSAKESHGRS